MGLSSTAAAAGRRAKAGLRRIRRAARKPRAAGPPKPFDAAVAFTHYCRTLPLDPDLVLYQAHSGAAMACNPYAIFSDLLANPEFARLQHVWVLDSEPEIRRRRREYAGHPNVRFVADGSQEYLRALATAGYLIQNTTFSAWFAKRPGQVYVMTWHSAGAVKKMGVDLPAGNYGSRNVVRNLLMADHLISPNELMTSVFADSYRQRGLFPGKLLEFGYPRNDVTLHTPRQAVIDELTSRGVQVDPARKIILYAPTWRGTLGNVRGDAEELEAVRSTIEAGIDTDEYQVLIKPHHYLYSRLTKSEKRSGRYLPRQVNANRLLAAVDILVSDYSSIFFDFLVTGRPVLFYIPDLIEYTAERGVYFTMDELPGPVTADAAELAGWINDLPGTVAGHAERYARMKALACTHEDGHATRRTVDVVFGNRQVAGVTDTLIDPARKRVLLYTDDLDSTPATEALLTLEANLDPDTYDVTVAGIGHSAQSRDNADRIVSRTMAQTGRPTLSPRERYALEALRRHGLTAPAARLLRPEDALRREWRRRFGDATFDIIVECSRRPGAFGWLATLNPGAKLVVWQRPQLAAAPDPLEAATAPAPGDTRPLTKASLARLYRAADAVVPPSNGLRKPDTPEFATALRNWEELLASL
jgi:CDP-glycerol glycerophosphotransferase (TagB/SpsB family)